MKGDRTLLFTINEILDIAIQIEMNGEEAYRRAMEKTSDPALHSILDWVANEEADHRKWFAVMKEKMASISAQPPNEEMNFAAIKALLGNKTFSLEDEEIHEIQDINELLTLSMEFEKDTILFYQLLRSFLLEDETKHHLDKIIEEENLHIEKLKELLALEEI